MQNIRGSAPPEKHMRLQKESWVGCWNLTRLGQKNKSFGWVMKLQESSYIQREPVACRQHNGQWKGISRGWSLKSAFTAWEHSKPNLRRSLNTVCECYVAKKKTPTNVSYLCLCAMLHHFTLHQHKTSYPNASPPLRHCACPKTKQALP